MAGKKNSLLIWSVISKKEKARCLAEVKKKVLWELEVDTACFFAKLTHSSTDWYCLPGFPSVP